MSDHILDRLGWADGPDTDLDYALTLLVAPGAVRHSSAHLPFTSNTDAALSLCEDLHVPIISITRDGEKWVVKTGDDRNASEAGSPFLAMAIVTSAVMTALVVPCPADKNTT